MGTTVEHLSQIMSAQEFGQHLVLEHEEPLGRSWQLAVAHLLAALANGPLQRPQAGRNWGAADFLPEPWQDDEADTAEDETANLTVEQILQRARLAGMMH